MGCLSALIIRIPSIFPIKGCISYEDVLHYMDGMGEVCAEMLGLLLYSYTDPVIRDTFLKIKNHWTSYFISIVPSNFSFSPCTFTWCDHCTFLLCKTFHLCISLDSCLCYFC